MANELSAGQLAVPEFKQTVDEGVEDPKTQSGIGAGLATLGDLIPQAADFVTKMGESADKEARNLFISDLSAIAEKSRQQGNSGQNKMQALLAQRIAEDSGRAAIYNAAFKEFTGQNVNESLFRSEEAARRQQEQIVTNTGVRLFGSHYTGTTEQNRHVDEWLQQQSKADAIAQQVEILKNQQSIDRNAAQHGATLEMNAANAKFAQEMQPYQAQLANTTDPKERLRIGDTMKAALAQHQRDLLRIQRDWSNSSNGTFIPNADRVAKTVAGFENSIKLSAGIDSYKELMRVRQMQSQMSASQVTAIAQSTSAIAAVMNLSGDDPATLAKMRQFARKMEPWLQSALKGVFPDEFGGEVALGMGASAFSPGKPPPESLDEAKNRVLENNPGATLEQSKAAVTVFGASIYAAWAAGGKSPDGSELVFNSVLLNLRNVDSISNVGVQDQYLKLMKDPAFWQEAAKHLSPTERGEIGRSLAFYGQSVAKNVGALLHEPTGIVDFTLGDAAGTLSQRSGLQLRIGADGLELYASRGNDPIEYPRDIAKQQKLNRVIQRMNELRTIYSNLYGDEKGKVAYLHALVSTDLVAGIGDSEGNPLLVDNLTQKDQEAVSIGQEVTIRGVPYLILELRGQKVAVLDKEL